MGLLSDEIVNRHLAEKLGMPDWKLRLKENRLQFLKDFILAHAGKIYYQNISWSAVPKPLRKYPTIEEVIYHGTSSPGGTCIHVNYFVYLLLQHLGYDTFIVGCEIPVWPTRRCHVLTIVRMPVQQSTTHNGHSDQNGTIAENTKEQIYMIDYGYAGRVFWELIPLHHEVPYRSRCGGFDVEYRFNPDTNFYERIAIGGCPYRGKFEEEKERNLEYYFDLNPLTFDDFPDCYEDLFSSRGTSHFLDLLLLHCIPVIRSPDDFEYVSVRNVVMVHGTKDTYREVEYESFDAMLPALKKYYPELNWNEVQAAFPRYAKAREEKLAADAAKAAAEASN